MHLRRGCQIVSSDEFTFIEFVFDRIRIWSPSSETDFRPNSSFDKIRLTDLTEFKQILLNFSLLSVILLRMDGDEWYLIISKLELVF